MSTLSWLFGGIRGPLAAVIHLTLLQCLEPILDTVLAPSWKKCGDREPFRTELGVTLEQSFIFSLCPLGRYEGGVCIIRPSFTALPGGPTGDVERDLLPVCVAQVRDDLQQQRILGSFEFRFGTAGTSASHQRSEMTNRDRLCSQIFVNVYQF
jgi:hypothetical protein